MPCVGPFEAIDIFEDHNTLTYKQIYPAAALSGRCMIYSVAVFSKLITRGWS